MRILVTGLSKKRGGIGTLLMNFAKCNSLIGGEDQLELEFLVPKGSEYIDVLNNEGYVYYECPRILEIFSYYTRIREILLRKTYDYVWINNTSKIDIILPKLIKKNSYTKIIQHSHGIDMEEKGLKRLIFIIIEYLFGKKYETYIDIPLACSQASADYFYHNKELRSKCIILGNGIFTEKFKFNQQKRTEIRSKLNICTDDILIGTVGRLTKVKNYPFFIQLVSALPFHFKGIIVGDGEDRAILSEMIKRENLTDRFFLVGEKNNIADYYSAMDIFVMPSFNEGLPFSIIEAQTTGLTCIASTGISRECDVTGNIVFSDINNQEDWLKLCIDYRQEKYNRNEFCDKVKEKGFSIEETFRLFMMLIEVQ